ncbi:MAG: 6-phosphofructokinase [Verrucomicrobia bacterium]|jgi:ADP-dependent phosphofructokinase/glucokinase|nr:6-phosphofructokinase [Verrucomicrobiota bacterium]
MSAHRWVNAYERVLQLIPAYVQDARLTLCGLSTCVDAYVRLHEAKPLLNARTGSPEAMLGKELIRRAINGVGGELYLNWPEGGRWVEQHLHVARWGVGGSGAQAAQTLAVIGAPALMSLQDRGWRQLSVLHPDICVATAAGFVKCGGLRPTDGMKPAHYIFEFTAGTQIGSAILKRSSRTIVRFGGEHLDDDPDFIRESVSAAKDAGAGVLSGLNEIDDESVDDALSQTIELAQAWKECGLRHIHLEVGDYETAEVRNRVLNLLRGDISSLGMSYSELCGILPGEGDAVEKACELAEALDLRRLCVHSDTWALTVTREDPFRELEGLLFGSLLASTRAEKGVCSLPVSLPGKAEFHELKWKSIQQSNERSVVSCATPYLEHPAATIGLGDTFLAGTLLVLGGALRSNTTATRVRSL